ncbi:MAG: hypothetical protein AB8G99_27395 [Planctomycetaceae bacterium]
MPIHVECDACAYEFNAADKFEGKLVRCPECSETIRVGEEEPAARPRRTERPRRTASRSEARSSRSRPE